MAWKFIGLVASSQASGQVQYFMLYSGGLEAAYGLLVYMP